MASDLSMSDTFFLELARVVEVNMGDEHFGANELASEVGLSRSHIHRKLKSITGKSTSQFIKEIRLRQAHELLEDRVGTASEIAYKVGFNSSTYFTKCFHDYFGYPPGSVKILGSNLQLTAIMFTDIVGYTALMGKDEQKAFKLLKKNRSVQRPIIEKFNGRWLKEIGDGVLASFSTVSDAVYCAATIQKTCEDHPDLNLRIGIHLGEVVFEGDDVFGDGVNIASRLEPLAPINGILVSESVHRNLGNKTNIVSSFIREEQLKNVTEPIKIYSVQVEGIEPLVLAKTSDTTQQQVSPKARNKGRKMAFTVAGVLIILLLSYFLYSNFSTKQSQADSLLDVTHKSIAVLPFKNDSPDQDNQYFCNGMVEEIVNYLLKISALEVKARTSVEQYRNSSRDIKAIAKELEVAYIIKGSVRKFGDDIRITAQLIEAKTGYLLWSETYDGKYTDKIFEFQSEIAKKIAASLNVIIIPEEEEEINKNPATDMVAYDLYIRGNHERWAHSITRQDKHAKAAHDLFDQALKIDPNYVLAIVGKGQTFNKEGKHDSAFVYADRAIAVDPEFNRSIGLKGYCYLSAGEIDLALDHFFKAISLPPKDDFWLWYHVAIGQVYYRQNDQIKAIPYLKKGLEMTGTQYMAGAYSSLTRPYKSIGDYETAEEYFSKSLELEVGCGTISHYIGLMLTQGKIQEALQFADSTCQQEEECEQVCSRILFKTSLLLGEFEKAEQHFYQWQNKGSDFPYWERFIKYEIGYVFYQLGRAKEAEKIFTEQIIRLESELVKEGHITYLHLSRIYAFKGERRKALENLNEFAKRGFTEGWHDFILIDPFFESLRDDPEFKAIVKQAQEEKAALRVQVREMEARGELTL